LTFTTAPAANTSFFAVLLGSDNGGTVTPTDGSVTSDKLVYPFVVNEDGAAASDFRVESDSNTHMLFVDAGNNMVGINESSPSSYYYNDLVVNSGDEGGITIVDTSGGQSALAFGDSTSGAARYSGRILYDHSTDKMRIGAGGNTYLIIDGDGHMTNASQSAFHVDPSTDQNNFGQDPDAWVNVVFGTEVFDQNADFASNTFTAPVTGRYFLNAVVRLNSVDEAANYYWLRLNTSNRIIYGTLYDLDGLGSDPNYWALTVCALTDMDANDTVTLDIIQNGGTIQTDVDGSGTHFSGFLAC